MKTTNKAFKKWNDLLDTKIKYANAPWSENELIYFRKACGRSGIKDERLRSLLVGAFEEQMPEGGYNITEDHKLKGINYLLAKSFKLTGELRKNNIFNTFQLSILRNYTDFKLVGLHANCSNDGQVWTYDPVFRCMDHEGNFFDYTGRVYCCIEILKTDFQSLKAV